MLNIGAVRRDFLKLSGVGALGAALGTASAYGHQKQAVLGAAIYDVRAFGATGGGNILDTVVVNKAIDAAASAGGGTILFPSGSYLCYSIRLKSNVSLYLGPGATIVGADPATAGGNGYDPPEPNQWDKYQDFGHSHWHNSLIWGEGLSNISICGPGRIWGRGLSRGEGDKALAPGVGNKSISLKNCHNVTLRDISILHGGHFAILATGVDNLTIDNLLIDTNRDGIDVDCCRNVRISNCSVNSPWDDGICPKSSYALGYARPTDHVTITNCYVTGGYEEGTLLDATYKRIGPDYKAPRNGRIKLGTESNGGFRNITISNCVIDDCRGIALETVDGGLLEDVSISNITMRDITDVPFFMRLGARMRGPEGTPVGYLRRVLVSNVLVSNADSRQSALITGIPGHNIEDVKFSNVCIEHQGGGTKDAASIIPPENETGYPEPNRFGPMPAQGFFIRHVKGIEMRDVEIRSLREDSRPAFVLEDVNSAEFIHPKVPPGSPSWALRNVKDFRIWQSGTIPDTYLAQAEQKML
ncbi:MAG: exo-poly-alpha-D-galacturonosidase [Acidobacteria bacterium]|nr:MAG: exo-poly-alpha-D-galacturonosidase [Acidobacteriota bacterium]PYV68736.1 MAG: exo-poly-alpha-D-galacturonosidase [Acidobacteriota bacterium]